VPRPSPPRAPSRREKATLKIPQRLEPLVEAGLVDSVSRQLMSGKEAMIYVVRCGGELRCAKVYKEADKRAFRQSVDYTEGRRVKNSRRGRAMEKRSRYGRQAKEEAWQSAEVNALVRLAAAGVRVPRPYNFIDGVLLMELVTDAEGNAAPRLADVTLSPEQARDIHRTLVREAVRMLCAGVVHADLSEYNVLIGHDGTVIIDLPQAVDAAGNAHAGAMFERDLANITASLGRFAPELLETRYGEEIWSLYRSGALHPESDLTGRFERIENPVDVDGVIRVVDHALKEEAARQLYRQEMGRK